MKKNRSISDLKYIFIYDKTSAYSRVNQCSQVTHVFWSQTWLLAKKSTNMQNSSWNIKQLLHWQMLPSPQLAAVSPARRWEERSPFSRQQVHPQPSSPWSWGAVKSGSFGSADTKGLKIDQKKLLLGVWVVWVMSPGRLQCCREWQWRPFVSHNGSIEKGWRGSHTHWMDARQSSTRTKPHVG